MLHASPAELRLALGAFIAATGETPAGMSLCASMMAAACASAADASAPVLRALGAEDLTRTRLAAVRVLASACASCAACPRGQDLSADTLIEQRRP